MKPELIGAGPVFIPPMNNLFAAGMQVGGKMAGAGSTGRLFSPASNGFQLGDGFRSPAQRAMHAAAGEAHAGMLDQVRLCMTPSPTNENTPTGGLRLIDSAQSKALDAVFRHADDPTQVEQVYAAGRYAARIGVEDLAVALSELRIQSNAQDGAPEYCDRLEKALCKMIVKDGLGDHSGFSAWHEGNCYDKVKKLTEEINARLDALPGKPDIFEGVMQREVMPAIRQYIQANYGNQSYETWQKIDAAGGLISHAAAEAADRMTATLRAGEQEGGAGGLRAKVNQWRVAQHWAEMMRSTAAMPEQSRPPAPAAAPEHPAPVTPSATAARPVAPYSVSQTANPVFKPIIVIGGREVNSTLARILEHDEATATTHADESDAVRTPQATARQTAEVKEERPDVRMQRNEEHGEHVPTLRNEVMNEDVLHQIQGGREDDHDAAQTQEPVPAGADSVDHMVTELDGRLPQANAESLWRSPAQKLRINIPVPPPRPDSAGSSVSSSPLPTTASTSMSPSPSLTNPASPVATASTASTTSMMTPTSATSLDEHQGDDAVTLRDRSLSPIQQLIKRFEAAGIGTRRPIGNAAHIGSLLHSVGNRISTTEWPMLRSVSDGDGGIYGANGSGDRTGRPTTPVGDEPVSLRSRPLSPPLQPGYTRLSSEAGRAAASSFQRVSTAGRAIQVGPGFEPFRGK